jgi:hypothetical protein
VLLLASVVFTALAVLTALGLWREPVVSDIADDAIALGLTALTTWLFFNVRPAVRRGTTLIEQLLDERHATTILTPVTVGWPVDLVRLYKPHYTDDREARVTRPPLDERVHPGGRPRLEPGRRRRRFRRCRDGLRRQHRDRAGDRHRGQRPVSQRYTNERLTWRNVWGRKGFLSHGGYWDEPEREDCLHLVMRAVMP